MRHRVLLGALIAALALNSFISAPARDGGPRGPANQPAAAAEPHHAQPETQPQSAASPSLDDPNM